MVVIIDFNKGDLLQQTLEKTLFCLKRYGAAKNTIYSIIYNVVKEVKSYLYYG